jgi:alginate O-acetyltransferase complex protein AlgI
MLFLDRWFWLFAAGALPAYWLSPRTLKLWTLLAVSAVFQLHFAGPDGMTPVLLLGALTYAAGLTPGGRPLAAVTWVAVIGALVFYKYSDFLLENVAGMLPAVQAASAGWRAPAPPLGISFFTFEFIHYLYEVRARGRQPIASPAHFSVFAIFFPCLAAGPIKRFPDFVPQLDALRNPRADEVWAGTRRLIQGLFKKVCLADLLVEYVKVLETLPHFDGPSVALLAVLQGLRIYFDFSGYSDMAIGLGRLLALRVPENFDWPYLSTNLQDFWRRWHMSLSSWIRDYIYIPLGGNRAHRALNLLLAMTLCGLWHGAAWNFALWGVYHGLGLVVEAGVRRWLPSLFAEGRGRRLVGWAICYIYVTYGWLLFFYPLNTVYRMTEGMLGWAFAG